MQTSMKPLFMRETAMRFLEVTVVHSMEGVLFALLSVLFTIAGVAAVVEDWSGLAASNEMTAAAPAAAAPVLAERPPQPAGMQQASYLPPDVR
jgi:hypothetical protein